MPVPTTDELRSLIDAEFDLLVEMRRSIHRRPELGFRETATTSLINQRCAEIGLDRRNCPTETGAVWELQGGQPGPTVLLRADIDALPIEEAADVPFKSEFDGLMHACGHDAHTAQLLGAASAMAQRADELPGRYVFVFQPAEEALGGAIRMVEGGLLDGLDAKAVVGCHVASIVPVGLVGVRSGVTMSEVHQLTIHVAGLGGHGAVAEGANPLTTAAAISLELAGIVEGMSLEGTPCACSAGFLHAGTASNVIPDHAVIEGTLRTFTPEQTTEALAALSEMAKRIAADTGCEIDIRYSDHAPAVVNDPGVTELVRAAAIETVGEAATIAMPPVSPSDDVSELLNRIPGTYFFVGAGLPDGSSGMHHNPGFAIDEGCMPIAATVLAAGAIRAAIS